MFSFFSALKVFSNSLKKAKLTGRTDWILRSIKDIAWAKASYVSLFIPKKVITFSPLVSLTYEAVRQSSREPGKLVRALSVTNEVRADGAISLGTWVRR